MTTTISHWVDGAAYPGTSGLTADVTNPASGLVTGRVALAGEDDARYVIESSARAAGAWGATSLARRTQVMFCFRELLNQRRDELARLVCAEHGKVLSDALGEIIRGQEVVEFACGI
ncbi:MAG: aldehyde dehydrogenase family protein, partial [Nocardioidaceae bacterium]